MEREGEAMETLPPHSADGHEGQAAVLEDTHEKQEDQQRVEGGDDQNQQLPRQEDQDGVADGQEDRQDGVVEQEQEDQQERVVQQDQDLVVGQGQNEQQEDVVEQAQTDQNEELVEQEQEDQQDEEDQQDGVVEQDQVVGQEQTDQKEEVVKQDQEDQQEGVVEQEQEDLVVEQKQTDQNGEVVDEEQNDQQEAAIEEKYDQENVVVEEVQNDQEDFENASENEDQERDVKVHEGSQEEEQAVVEEESKEESQPHVEEGSEPVVVEDSDEDQGQRKSELEKPSEEHQKSEEKHEESFVEQEQERAIAAEEESTKEPEASSEEETIVESSEHDEEEPAGEQVTEDAIEDEVEAMERKRMEQKKRLQEKRVRRQQQHKQQETQATDSIPNKEEQEEEQKEIVEEDAPSIEVMEQKRMEELFVVYGHGLMHVYKRYCVAQQHKSGTFEEISQRADSLDFIKFYRLCVDFGLAHKKGLSQSELKTLFVQVAKRGPDYKFIGFKQFTDLLVDCANALLTREPWVERYKTNSARVRALFHRMDLSDDRRAQLNKRMLAFGGFKGGDGKLGGHMDVSLASRQVDAFSRFEFQIVDDNGKPVKLVNTLHQAGDPQTPATNIRPKRAGRPRRLEAASKKGHARSHGARVNAHVTQKEPTKRATPFETDTEFMKSLEPRATNEDGRALEINNTFQLDPAKEKALIDALELDYQYAGSRSTPRSTRQGTCSGMSRASEETSGRDIWSPNHVNAIDVPYFDEGDDDQVIPQAFMPVDAYSSGVMLRPVPATLEPQPVMMEAKEAPRPRGKNITDQTPKVPHHHKKGHPTKSRDISPKMQQDKKTSTKRTVAPKPTHQQTAARRVPKASSKKADERRVVAPSKPKKEQQKTNHVAIKPQKPNATKGYASKGPSPRESRSLMKPREASIADSYVYGGNDPSPSFTYQQQPTFHDYQYQMYQQQQPSMYYPQQQQLQPQPQRMMPPMHMQMQMPIHLQQQQQQYQYQYQQAPSQMMMMQQQQQIPQYQPQSFW